MEGKKSFVLYTDLIHTVKKLPKEKQADLFVMILDYVNDKNPTTDDLLVDIAFEPIKRQLKRDLVKYEDRAKRSRENGSKGGRPPKDENPEEPSGLQENPRNPGEPKKPDSVNVTVNGNVNDINNKRAFKVDANENLKEYRLYLHDLIKEKAISRDQLFAKCRIDIERRQELWESFILNSIENVPRIEDDKHAWNTFKKYINDNCLEWQEKKISNFEGF